MEQFLAGLLCGMFLVGGIMAWVDKIEKNVKTTTEQFIADNLIVCKPQEQDDFQPPHIAAVHYRGKGKKGGA
jgi:hypothetical protein